jgi:hypothetical protein
MAYAVTIDSASILAPLERPFPERADLERGSAIAAPATLPDVGTSELRRLKRVVAYGPRCPDCTGPLVFGEGCQLCPVCGYSACGGRA